MQVDSIKPKLKARMVSTLDVVDRFHKLLSNSTYAATSRLLALQNFLRDAKSGAAA